MSETVCARCDTRAETRWRIDLETGRENAPEQRRYPLCGECWEEVTARFAGPTPGES